MRKMAVNTFFGPDLELFFDELLGAFGQETQGIAAKVDGVFLGAGILVV